MGHLIKKIPKKRTGFQYFAQVSKETLLRLIVFDRKLHTFRVCYDFKIDEPQFQSKINSIVPSNFRMTTLYFYFNFHYLLINV